MTHTDAARAPRHVQTQAEMLCIYVGVGLFAWVVLEVFL